MTECARCGDCCRKILVPYNRASLAAPLASPACHGGIRAERVFLATHWTPTGEVKRGSDGVLYHEYDCDQLTEDNLCAAHESRPQVCRGFPWYGRAPKGASLEGMSKRCSFWADIPAQERPSGVRPLIPLTVL